MKILKDNPLVNDFLQGVLDSWDPGDENTPRLIEQLIAGIIVQPKPSANKIHDRATTGPAAHVLPPDPRPRRADAKPLQPNFRKLAAGPENRHETERSPLTGRARGAPHEQGHGGRRLLVFYHRARHGPRHVLTGGALLPQGQPSIPSRSRFTGARKNWSSGRN